MQQLPLTLLEHAHDAGADHGAEQRFLGIEVEVERSLADAGVARDVLEARARETLRSKDFECGVQDLVGAGVGAALPAGEGDVSSVVTYS